MRNILVVPSGTEIGLDIHDALVRRRDVRLFGAESTKNSHAAFVYKRNYQVPSCHEVGFIDAINDLVAQHKIDYVFPAHDDVQLSLLEAGRTLQCALLSSPLETVAISRFKSRTYDCLAGVVPIPRRIGAREVRPTDFPVFVKPDRGQGSQNTHRCTSAEQLAAVLQEPIDWVVCEYLPGRELTVDCFSDRDTGLKFVDCRQRVRVRAGISVRAEPFACDAAMPMAVAIAARMRFHGAWFFQIREKAPDDWVLLEVGARIPGGSTYQRLRGVNFPLLCIFEYERLPVKIALQPLPMVMDRAFVSRLQLDLSFSVLYVDFDDTLSMHGAPNAEVVALMVVARHHGKRIVLLSRNAGDCHDWLASTGIAALIDEIVLIERTASKSDFVNADSLLIDDSFADREECRAVGAVCFDVDAAPALVQMMQRS